MNRDVQDNPNKENSELPVPLPPPARFDEGMVAVAQSVEPLPRSWAADWRARWRLRGGPGLIHAIAITAVLCIALGAILVGFQQGPDNSFSLANRSAGAADGDQVPPDLGNKSVRIPEASTNKSAEDTPPLRQVKAFESRTERLPRQEQAPNDPQFKPRQNTAARKVDTLYFGRAVDNHRKGKHPRNRNEADEDH